MIKSKELRRGNLFHPAHWDNDVAEPLTSSWYEVDVIWEDEVGYMSVGHFFRDKLENIFPIGVTPEWLEKLGFVESNSYDSKQRNFKKEGFRQLADYGTQLIVLPQGGFAYLSCGYYENQIDCAYVHQLQNLYFALTGEELTIKETV